MDYLRTISHTIDKLNSYSNWFSIPCIDDITLYGYGRDGQGEVYKSTSSYFNCCRFKNAKANIKVKSKTNNLAKKYYRKTVKSCKHPIRLMGRKGKR
jgi:hypothetical protein